MQEDEKLIEYVIPDNIMEAKRFMNFRIRNWIEGLICAGTVGVVIYMIPFVFRVKLIFLVCICGPILYLNLIGIKDQSLIEAFLNLHAAIRNSGEYHLRRPDRDERTKNIGTGTYGVANGESAADKLIAFCKEKIQEIRK